MEINTCSISIPDNIGLSQTAKLPAKLELCVGARIMLTDNISVPDRLINGSIGTVKIGYHWADNSLKDRRLCGELKDCVPISAREKAKKKGKSTVIAERKQFLLIICHAITVHKSQESTLAYMQGDLNWSTGKKTATGKNYQQPISQRQVYIVLSHVKICDKVLSLNFEPEDIKVNESEWGNEENVIIFLATPLKVLCYLQSEKVWVIALQN